MGERYAQAHSAPALTVPVLGIRSCRGLQPGCIRMSVQHTLLLLGACEQPLLTEHSWRCCVCVGLAPIPCDPFLL